mgnify:CR=1 FL=1
MCYHIIEAINALENNQNYDQNFDESIASVIALLRNQHETAKSAEWTVDELADLLLGEQDATDLTQDETLIPSIRDIQHDIIYWYGIDED